MNGDSTVTINQCDRRMSEVRNEIQVFCSTVTASIDGLKDELHKKEVVDVAKHAEVEAEIAREKSERTLKDWVFVHYQDLLLAFIVIMVSGGRAYDLLMMVKQGLI
jgi:hypothetical protein